MLVVNKVMIMMVLVIAKEVFKMLLVVNKVVFLIVLMILMVVLKTLLGDKHWEQLLFISGPSSPGGVFFSPIGSGPRGSGLWNGDRDKHWEQLLFISGPSSPGAVFFSYWIWAQGQRLVEWG